jgi:hypothetical protein
MKRTIRTLLSGAFLISVGVVWCRMWPGPVSVGDVPWAVWLSIALAAATTVAAQTRELPVQNVLLASAIIAVAGLVGGTVDKLPSVELIEQSYSAGGGATLFGSAFWATPIMWVVLILNGRGVAKLLLRPWRRTPHYGFWVLGSAVLLVMGLETSAVAINQCSGSMSHMTDNHWAWTHWAVWTVLALVTLAVVTPMLINKSVVERAPTPQPLLVWLAINFLVLTDAALRQVWSALGLLGGEMVLISIFALRNDWNTGTGKQATETSRKCG